MRNIEKLLNGSYPDILNRLIAINIGYLARTGEKHVDSSPLEIWRVISKSGRQNTINLES